MGSLGSAEWRHFGSAEPTGSMILRMIGFTPWEMQVPSVSQTNLKFLLTLGKVYQ